MEDQEQKPGTTETGSAAAEKPIGEAARAVPRITEDAGAKIQAPAASAADSAEEDYERSQRRRAAFEKALEGPMGEAVKAIHGFYHAMDSCFAETPEEVLNDTGIKEAAKKAREGLKLFTGEVEELLPGNIHQMDQKPAHGGPTSDAHLNRGTGGAVTGNVPQPKAEEEKAEGEEVPEAVVQ